jgi:hypothetical protein
VIRFLATLIVGASTVCGEEQLNPPPVAPVPAPAQGGPSVVAVASDPRVLDGFEEDAAVSRELVDRLVRTVTQKPSATAAWREIAEPGDRVGIKVSTAGGRYFGTRRGVVAAVVAGLRSAG